MGPPEREFVVAEVVAAVSEQPVVEAVEVVAPITTVVRIEAEAEAVIVDTATTDTEIAAANPITTTNEVAVNILEDALPPVDEATATAAVEVEPFAADTIDAVVVDEAPEVAIAAHVEPVVEAPAEVAAAVEVAVVDAAPAATEVTSVDDEAARRAEQLRGLFQTARHDAANAPLAQDDDTGEANRGA